MKGFGLAFAFAAVAWLAAPTGQVTHEGPAITAGIDAGSAPHSDCIRGDSDRLSGCEGDEFRVIVVAAIDGTD